MGIHKLTIDRKEFEDLCRFQCSKSEIAYFFRMSIEDLESVVAEEYGDKFDVVYRKYAQAGKCDLRRYQFQLAQTNAQMAIWLGRQYLGQRDDFNITDGELSPLKIEYVQQDKESADKRVERIIAEIKRGNES